MGLTDRRKVLVGLGAAAVLGSQRQLGRAQTPNGSPDLVLFNGKISTLDRQNPSATAVAISNGRFVAVGSDSDIFQRLAPNVQRVLSAKATNIGKADMLYCSQIADCC